MNRPPPPQGRDLSQRVAAHDRRPAYHGTSHATGCNPRQRFWLVFAVFALSRFAADCHELQPRAPQRLHPVGALRLTFARLPTTRCCDCGLTPSRGACVVRSGGRPRPGTLGRALPTGRRAVSISLHRLMARSSVMMSARVIDSASSMKARRYVTRSSRLRRSRELIAS
jgi:hypothetical protein